MTSWTLQQRLQMLRQKSAPDTALAWQDVLSWSSWASRDDLLQTAGLQCDRSCTQLRHACSWPQGLRQVRCHMPLIWHLGKLWYHQKTSSAGQLMQMNWAWMMHWEIRVLDDTISSSPLSFHLFWGALFLHKSQSKMLSSQFNEVNFFLCPKSIACSWNGILRQCVQITGILVPVHIWRLFLRHHWPKCLPGNTSPLRCSVKWVWEMHPFRDAQCITAK